MVRGRGVHLQKGLTFGMAGLRVMGAALTLGGEGGDGLRWWILTVMMLNVMILSQ